MEKKKIDKETLCGAILATITIIAIICEIIFGDFSKSAIAGGIKDISSTIIDVFVFFFAWFALHPRKSKSFAFESELANRLKMWQEEHSNLIFFKDEENPLEIHMKTNIENYFEGGHKEFPGRFVLITLGDKIKLSFSLNRSLLVGHGVEDAVYKATAEKVTNQITTYVDGIYKKDATIKSTSNYNIEFIMNSNEKNEYEIDRIMAIINTMYQSFLVVASTNK